MDIIFKALADPSRRRLLDRLHRRNGQTLRELCDGLDMARQSVTKHLAVLEAAELVTTRRRGREKLHYLNAAPISEVAERWIDKYDRERVEALADLKRALEDTTMEPAGPTEFVYTTYIKTTPEMLWQALTAPAFTRRYWGIALQSDWQVGSAVLWESPGGPFREVGSVVVESDPPRRLAYTWHDLDPSHAAVFGWSEARFAAILAEKKSQVAFDIEPVGPVVRLTVTHGNFEPGSEVFEACSGRTPQSGGWPELLANLKTLLESGNVLFPAGVAEGVDSGQ